LNSVFRLSKPHGKLQILPILLLFLQHDGGAIVVEGGLGDLAAWVPFELNGRATLIFQVEGSAKPRKQFDSGFELPIGYLLNA
jgi:hypothetical protein